MQISFSHKRYLEIDDPSITKKQKCITIDQSINRAFYEFVVSLRLSSKSGRNNKNKIVEKLNKFLIFEKQFVALYPQDQIITYILNRLESTCDTETLNTIKQDLNLFTKYAKHIRLFVSIIRDIQRVDKFSFQFHLNIQKMRQIKALLIKESQQENIANCIIKHAFLKIDAHDDPQSFIIHYLKEVNETDSEALEKQAELRKTFYPLIIDFLKNKSVSKKKYYNSVENIKKKKLELIQKYDDYYIDKIVTDLLREQNYTLRNQFIDKYLKLEKKEDTSSKTDISSNNQSVNLLDDAELLFMFTLEQLSEQEILFEESCHLDSVLF